MCDTWMNIGVIKITLGKSLQRSIRRESSIVSRGGKTFYLIENNKFTPRMTKMFEKLTTQEKPVSNRQVYETEASNSISPVVEKDIRSLVKG
jgi:hypothetical protein